MCSEAIASTDFIRLEKEVFVPLAGTGKLAVYTADGFWSSIKNPTYEQREEGRREKETK